MTGHSQSCVFVWTPSKEVEWLVKIGVLMRQPASEGPYPTYIILKKNKAVCFISDFRNVNKQLVRTPFLIPKISIILQEIEELTYVNMGHYTKRLDLDVQKICTIII